MAVVVEFDGAVAGVVGVGSGDFAERHHGLVFAHAKHRLVLIDGGPHRGGPEAVELVGIFVEEDIVVDEVVATIVVVADGSRVESIGIRGFRQGEGEKHVALAGSDAEDGGAGGGAFSSKTPLMSRGVAPSRVPTGCA